MILRKKWTVVGVSIGWGHLDSQHESPERGSSIPILTKDGLLARIPTNRRLRLESDSFERKSRGEATAVILAG